MRRLGKSSGKEKNIMTRNFQQFLILYRAVAGLILPDIKLRTTSCHTLLQNSVWPVPNVKDIEIETKRSVFVFMK